MNIEILTEPIVSKIVEINEVKLEVFSDGRVYRFKKNGDLKLIKNINNNGVGYNQIRCNNKLFLRHRIIAYTFLNLDINDLLKPVDHIDGNRLNNCLKNLRIVTSAQNSWNRLNVKGCCFDKSCNKWRAYINLNNKVKNLGYFNIEQEARDAYLKAKDIYHIIQ
tara:strand:+ start:226 stop:717 length:492 start_codon:yes stop_codon:yes gene_type:complete